MHGTWYNKRSISALTDVSTFGGELDTCGGEDDSGGVSNSCMGGGRGVGRSTSHARSNSKLTDTFPNGDSNDVACIVCVGTSRGWIRSIAKSRDGLDVLAPPRGTTARN